MSSETVRLDRVVRAAFLITAVSAGSLVGLDARAQQRPARPRPRQHPPPAASPSARTEILTFDNWVVTCRDGKDDAEKRVCSAELQIVQTANNASSVVFSWLIGLNAAGAPVSVLRFPSGVLIGPGVELKLLPKDARKIPFTSCEPARCDAAVVMDDGFMRDAAAAQTAEATIYASDGRGVKFTINMKGYQQGLAAIRK